MLVYAVCTMSLGYPALAGRFLVNPRSDQYIAGYAFREFARSHWSAFGEIPQWNPHLFGGIPFVDAMHGDTFYPTALLRILVGTDVGMTWGMIIHIFLAGLFTFFFLRSLGLAFFSALAGGVAYQMGGNLAGLVSPGHDGKIFVAALLPMALFLVVRGVRDGTQAAWGGLAIVIGLAVLSPHPQLLQYMLLLTGSFALFLAVGWGSDVAAGLRLRMTRLAFALGSVAMGMVIGAIQFWPVKTYVPFSPRAGGKGWEHAISFSLPPEEMFNFALPQFTGILDAYWGRNRLHFHSDYIGVSVLVLAGLALGAWSRRAEARLVIFWATAFVISLLWALGGSTPFYQLVYALVPGTKFFRAPSTMLYVVSFCTAVLAAFGCERLLRGQLRRRYLAVSAVVAALIGILGLSGGLSNLAVSLALPERVDAALANAAALRVGAIRSAAFALLAVGAAWMVATRRLSRDVAGILLIAVVATDLWTVLRTYWQFMPPAAESFASNAVIDYLRKQPGHVRVLPNQTKQSDVWRDPDLRYNGLMVHGVPQVFGYHGNELANYELLAGSADGYRQFGNPNFWALYNMRYIMTNSADSMGIAGTKLVAGPSRDAAGNDLYLYELPGRMSYAWVTPVIAKANDASTLGTVLDPRFDVRTAAIFDTAAAVTAREIQSLPQPLEITAKLASYEPGRVRIELDRPAPEGSALMVSENWYPGWTATVDGRPAALGRADVALIGVALPTGGRVVSLTFTNAPYESGKRATWLALAISTLLLVFGLIADRRQQLRG